VACRLLLHQPDLGKENAMATRKSTGRKRPTTKKKPARRKLGTGRARQVLARMEGDLPPNLAEFSRRVRRGLTRLERQIETARAGTARRSTGALREASRTLGRLEAQGQKRWKKLSTQTRKDAARVLRRLEKVIEPPKSKPSTASKPGTARKRTTKKR
jgi:hypothetical protein